MSRLSCRMGMGMGRNCELLDGKMGMGFKFQMGMGIKLLKWEGFGKKKSLPAHLYTSERAYSCAYFINPC